MESSPTLLNPSSPTEAGIPRSFHMSLHEWRLGKAALCQIQAIYQSQRAEPTVKALQVTVFASI